MALPSFDNRQRFLLPNYGDARPFASFLPGIAGPQGIPLWAFYVNRGQAIASFGVQSKDQPILEFQPANKAYQLTPYLGFRTFLNFQAEGNTPRLYEPFSPWHASTSTQRQMAIGLNELELQETAPERGLQVNVLYFIVPHEDFAGLARQVRLQNISGCPLAVNLLDGLPAVIPYGVTNTLLKEMSRTLEAWMEVVNLQDQTPFYRLRASVIDKVEVETYEAGHFALACLEQGQELHPLPAVVDPTLVFGANTSLSTPDGFTQVALPALLRQPQVTTGRTPCAFFGKTIILAPGEAVTLHTLYGHVSRMEKLTEVRARLRRPGYLTERRAQAAALAQTLTDAVATETSAPIFDSYCRQTFLDNVLRGGWPLTWGPAERPTAIYHLYSRKHGDLERDYNSFHLAAEPYSQGNGSYRDVNQNRRCDVLFNPHVADFNVRAFMSLIQADGYNPLVIQGSTFSLPPGQRPALLALAAQPAKLEPLLAKPFTPGRLLKALADNCLELNVSREIFVDRVMSAAEQHLEAASGEGYWIDHWTYNLDLIDTFLTVYPDRKAALLFDDATLPYYDSATIVRPRAEKYVLDGGQPRQLDATAEDKEKAALLAGRVEDRSWLHTNHGRGAVYRTTLFSKLAALALIKFTTLDPWGMGMEMEAGRPGWYDALNGLPGLFGSSMPETYELLRLVNFLHLAIQERGEGHLEWPAEMGTLLSEVASRLAEWQTSAAGDRDFAYWDAVTTARETYRAAIRLGVSGENASLSLADLAGHLAHFAAKLQLGICRALKLNHQLPPTYFTYQMEEYAPRLDAQGWPARDAHGRVLIQPRRFRAEVLPPFLEGPVHALRTLEDPADARALYGRVRAGPLFDQKLQMYKVNAPLTDQPHNIGRARVFVPGWLENESIWLHMEYKYLLEVLRAGLYAEFFHDFRVALVPFLDPATYGRSPLENSSFLVSSAHPDATLHGAGFVARLSGSTAEFLSLWSLMLAGPQPFMVQGSQLNLRLKPALPGWLFTPDGQVSFTFLGQCAVTYHNPRRLDTFAPGMQIRHLALTTAEGQYLEIAGDTLGAPYAAQVRAGQINHLALFF